MAKAGEFNMNLWEQAYDFYLRNTVDPGIGGYHVSIDHLRFKGKTTYQIYVALMREARCCQF